MYVYAGITSLLFIFTCFTVDACVPWSTRARVVVDEVRACRSVIAWITPTFIEV